MTNWFPIKIASYSLHGLAWIASLTRLIYRTRTRRLWWDDFWALVAFSFDVIMVSFWITRYDFNAPNNDLRRSMALVSVTSVLWGARLSIAVTIVRLVPPGPGRHVAKAMSVLFALMWCGLLVNKLFICQREVGGTLQYCQLPTETGILELCTDLIADIWLICSPAYLLWDVKLTHRRQILIFSVFASDVLLATASVVHCVYIIQQKRPNISLSAQFEVGISLIICNLLVLVTWMYSRIYPPDSETSSSSTDSVNYPTTTQAVSRSRHRNAPRYGFDGSALILTDLSTPSISIFSTFDNPSINSTYHRPWSIPRTHSLNALFPILPIPRETLPSYLRPTKTCPALLHSLVTSEKVGNDCDEIKWKNIRFDTRAVKRPPSLVLSSDESGSTCPEQTPAQNERARLYKS